jgi:hypothetical protein
VSTSLSHRRNTLASALRLLCLSALLIIVLAASARASLVVTIYSGTDYGDHATAIGWDPDYAENETYVPVPVTTTTTPYSVSVTASAGRSTATTTVSLTSSYLDWRILQARQAMGPYSEAYGQGIVVFSVSENTPYAFVGSYQSPESQTTILKATLYGGSGDALTQVFPTQLFSGNYQSNGEGTLTVGSPQFGSPAFTGSLTGELYSGKFYRFDYVASIVGSVPSYKDSEGSATGDLRLYFGSPTIPEPSTIIVWSLLGGLGITLGWWRRKKAA